MSDLEAANLELRKAEEQYRLNFENINDIIFTFDMDLKIISMSPSVEKLLGYKAEDFIGQSASDLGRLMKTQFTEQAIDDINRIINGEVIPPKFYEVTKKDGTMTIVEISASLIKRDGKAAGVVCVSRDITERKKSEEQLRDSEERFRILAESSPTAIMMFQNDKWIYANSAVTEITGYTKQEILAMNFWDFVHPDDQKIVIERVRTASRAFPSPAVMNSELLRKTAESSGLIFPGRPLFITDNPRGLFPFWTSPHGSRPMRRCGKAKKDTGFLSINCPISCLS